MNKTIIIAIALIGIILLIGCAGPGPADNNGTDDNGTIITAEELSTQVNQELIDETDTVEIGDMV